MDISVTPDNTRVLRIMSDFREFMQSTNRPTPSSATLTASFYQSGGIPFHMPEEAMESSVRKRKISSQSVLQEARIAQIESQHVNDEKAHKLARLDLENRNETLISENMKLKQKCDDLQLKVKQVTMQAIEAQDNLREERNMKTTEKDNLEDMVMELQKSKHSQEVDLQQSIQEMNTVSDQLRQQNSDLKMKMIEMEEKLEETTALLKRKNERISTLMLDKEKQEKCEATLLDYKMKVHDLELRLSRCDEAEDLAKVMKDDLQRLRSLEVEVASLRDANQKLKENETNVQLMKEKVLAAESRAERSDKRAEAAAVIELENKELILQLNDAKSLELKTGDNQDFSKMTELQQKEATLTYEKGELCSELTSSKKEIEILQGSIKEWQTKFDEKVESCSAKDTQIRHLQKRALLLAGERNSLRSILQSYDSELTATSHADQLMLRARNAESAAEKVHVRLQEVQKEAQDHKAESSRYKMSVKQLQAEILTLKQKLEQQCGERPDKDSTIEELRKKIEELEEERSEMQMQNDRIKLWMERNRMRGDFDPKHTRVLHFQMNPADMAHQQSKCEITELRAKYLKLQEKLRKMEESEDITTSDVTLNQGAQDLKEQLNASELRNQRLKEVFQLKIQEFRQACYSLTGFRIDHTVDSQFKLVPMYAESENDALLFKLDTNGEMQMLETEFSKTLTNLIELHLQHQNSIPMFLSSVIAELFSQQTMMTT